MIKFLYTMLLASCVVLSACTTSRGLAPVEKFLTETGGSLYRASLDENPIENASNLKAKYDENTKTVIELRKKTYSPFSLITGNSFEKELIPVDEFLHDKTRENFDYEQWVYNDYRFGKIIKPQMTVRINELKSVQDLVHKLATGQDAETKVK